MFGYNYTVRSTEDKDQYDWGLFKTRAQAAIMRDALIRNFSDETYTVVDLYPKQQPIATTIMFNWQDKCYQFLMGKGFNRQQAEYHMVNFVRDNSHEDFHFDVDIRVNKELLTRVLILLTKYYNNCLVF